MVFVLTVHYYLGFKVNSDEYKVMGLAPYGRPLYKTNLDNLIDVKDDGSFVNMKYFSYDWPLTMTNDKFNNLFETRKVIKLKINNFIWILHLQYKILERYFEFIIS